MPYAYEFTDQQFDRFQKLARPLIDTVGSLVDEALDALEKARDPSSSAKPKITNPSLMPGVPPLKHTTLRHGEVDGTPLAKSNASWNALLNTAVEAAASKGKSAAELHHLIGVPTVIGERTDTGYTFIKSAGISIQGQNADKAWREARRLANEADFPIMAEFTWQNKEGAANPGQSAQIVG